MVQAVMGIFFCSHTKKQKPVLYWLLLLVKQIGGLSNFCNGFKSIINAIKHFQIG